MAEYDKRLELRVASDQERRWRKAMRKMGYTSLSEWMREAGDALADKQLKPVKYD